MVEEGSDAEARPPAAAAAAAAAAAVAEDENGEEDPIVSVTPYAVAVAVADRSDPDGCVPFVGVPDAERNWVGDDRNPPLDGHRVGVSGGVLTTPPPIAVPLLLLAAALPAEADGVGGPMTMIKVEGSRFHDDQHPTHSVASVATNNSHPTSPCVNKQTEHTRRGPFPQSSPAAE